MTLKDLRPNTPFYIIYKGENPRCEIGSVVSVSAPLPMFQNNMQMYQTPQSTVDIRVKVGDQTLAFEKVPADLVVCDRIASDGQGLVLSGNKDAVNSEIEALLKQSRDIIASVPFHEDAITAYEQMLEHINPTYAKEKKQEEEITSLKSEMSGLKDGLSRIERLLLDSKNNNKKSN